MNKFRFKPTANPSGLLELKKMLEAGEITKKKYLLERRRLLNFNVYTGRSKREKPLSESNNDKTFERK